MCSKDSAARLEEREATTTFICCKSSHLSLPSPGPAALEVHLAWISVPPLLYLTALGSVTFTACAEQGTPVCAQEPQGGCEPGQAPTVQQMVLWEGLQTG